MVDMDVVMTLRVPTKVLCVSNKAGLEKKRKKKKKKKDPYTHVRFSFLSVCHSCTTRAGINLNSMQTAILRNGSLLHVNSKFCWFCRNYYLNVSQPLNVMVLSLADCARSVIHHVIQWRC